MTVLFFEGVAILGGDTLAVLRITFTNDQQQVWRNALGFITSWSQCNHKCFISRPSSASGGVMSALVRHYGRTVGSKSYETMRIRAIR